jgi:hypothetical protein
VEAVEGKCEDIVEVDGKEDMTGGGGLGCRSGDADRTDPFVPDLGLPDSDASCFSAELRILGDRMTLAEKLSPRD